MKTIDLFLIVRRAVEVKVKANILADSVCGEGLFAVYTVAPEGLCAHMVDDRRTKAHLIPLSLFTQVLISLMRAGPFMT